MSQLYQDKGADTQTRLKTLSHEGAQMHGDSSSCSACIKTIIMNRELDRQTDRQTDTDKQSFISPWAAELVATATSARMTLSIISAGGNPVFLQAWWFFYANTSAKRSC